ncbi:MAG: DUF86 domain-containing protein [Rhodospirillales bacterium]|nr:DUF86 domain-containing protein [Rhodospirillales bacterium]
MKSDLPYLGHINDAIAAIETYVSDGRETFLRERMVQDAVIRNFEVIGEAANRLSLATRDPASTVWRRVIAFRNRLIHGYWSVDLLLVWDVIQKDLPGLKLEVARLLRDLGNR